jgi:non-homologous end joining protein Ku
LSSFNVIDLMEALRQSTKNKKKGVTAQRTRFRSRKTNKRRVRLRGKRKAA